MENDLYLIQKTLEMTSDESCCQEVKDAAQRWLSARGSGEEEARREEYLRTLGECVQPIEAVLAFSGSPEAEKLFGREFARSLHGHYLEARAAGAKYCDCPACSAALKILEAAGRPLG